MIPLATDEMLILSMGWHLSESCRRASGHTHSSRVDQHHTREELLRAVFSPEDKLGEEQYYHTIPTRMRCVTKLKRGIHRRQ